MLPLLAMLFGLLRHPLLPRGPAVVALRRRALATMQLDGGGSTKDAVKAAKNPKVQKAANVTACVVASIMAGLCLATGIGIAAVASAATTLAVEPGSRFHALVQEAGASRDGETT